MKKLLALVLTILILLPIFAACDSYAVDLDFAIKDYIDTSKSQDTGCASHSGVTATCTSKAICEQCGAEYGEIDTAKHAGRVDWTKTEATHKSAYSCCGAIALDEEGHEWAAGICIHCGYRCVHSGGTATCTEKAICAICSKEYASKSQGNHTGNLKWINTDTTHSQFYDCCGTLNVAIEPHAWSEGVCLTCGYGCLHTNGVKNWTVTETTHTCAYTCCGSLIIAEEAHTLVDGACIECGYGADDEAIYTRDGDKIYFGSYPQSEVTDESLKLALGVLAGTLPTSNDSQAWTSYGYYVNSEVSNFMWYTDVELGGEKYRGVYFTSYRPWGTQDISSEAYSLQDDYGYTLGNVYWFKYEPISWTVLSEDGDSALILCDMIIDSREYYINEWRIDDNDVYPSNYAYSTIRAWLNDTFYNTAFNDLQKELIMVTEIDNSAASGGYASNPAACENTSDKIFLPSVEEITSEEYGFSSSATECDLTRQKKTTDYAKAQGAYTSPDAGYEGDGEWWLRSPDNYYICNAHVIEEGCVSEKVVKDTAFGVVPALNIRLS